MTSRTDIKTQVNRGLAWVGLASSMVWLLDILGMLLILRFWVSTSEYGTAMLVVTLFPVLDLASELGLNAAIIQRDDHTREKIATIFWLNVAASALLSVVLAFVVGPLLASVHEQPVLRWMLLAYVGKLAWQQMFIIPKALMYKHLRFKELSAIRTLSNFAEFLGKVGFAATGFGVWCFVLGPLCRHFVVGIGVQFCHPWRPKLVFRLREALDWMRFGIKASASQLVYHVYTNIDYQVVGYVFGKEANGLYSLGYELVIKPCFLIAQTLHGVAFPAYSRLKHKIRELSEQFILFTRMSMVVMLSALSVIMVTTEELLYTFWGPEWIAAAAPARILCGVGLLRAMSFVIPPLLDGMGRPGLSLLYNAIAAVILPTLFFASAYTLGDELGYLSVAWAWVFGYPIAFVTLLLMALRLIDLRLSSYLRRIIGIVTCAGVAIAVGFGAKIITADMASAVRLGIESACVVLVFFLLLAYTQDISPRSVKRALRGDKKSSSTTSAATPEADRSGA